MLRLWGLIGYRWQCIAFAQRRGIFVHGLTVIVQHFQVAVFHGNPIEIAHIFILHDGLCISNRRRLALGVARSTRVKFARCGIVVDCLPSALALGS
jgi:hypothetical protein